MYSVGSPCYRLFCPQAGRLTFDTYPARLTYGCGLLSSGSLESDTCLATSLLLRLVVLWQVVHWGWSEGGWASPFRCDFAAGDEYVDCREDARPLLLGCGAADFAGAGVVHMTGGAPCPTFDFRCPPTDRYLQCLQCFQGSEKNSNTILNRPYSPPLLPFLL